MRSFASCVAVIISSAGLATAQGPLNPPGPPAPMMKTLEQIEPRIPISAVNTPGDAGATFIINAPGSYYLTGNFTGESGKAGIFINSSNVTIDLNGFTMTGVGSNSAIAMPFPPARPQNTTVRNGSVTNWGFAVSLRERARVEALTIIGNAFNGLSVGNGSVIVDCIASNNGQAGISAGTGAVVRSTVAIENGGAGIGVAHGSVVSRCAAYGNGGSGISSSGGGSTIENCSSSFNGSVGIGGNDQSTVVDCTAMSNDGFGIIVFDASTVQRCTASNNRGGAGMHAENRSQVIGCVANANGNPSGATGHGIRMGLRGIVKQSTATQNRADGISVAGESVVVENRASQNGAGSGSAGIRTTNQSGSGSRVEANHIRDNNGAGIIASGADVVIRNTAGNNSPFGNYCDILLNPLSGPNVGPIGTVASTAHPAANYQ